MLRSRYPLEAWLAASTQRRTPGGIETVVKTVAEGVARELCLPKEPVPYYVHAIAEFAGMEPQLLSQIRRTKTEVCGRYLFSQPCVVFIYRWIEDRFLDPASGEPPTRNVLYVCASARQIERSVEVMAALAATPMHSTRLSLLRSDRHRGGTSIELPMATAR